MTKAAALKDRLHPQQAASTGSFCSFVFAAAVGMSAAGKLPAGSICAHLDIGQLQLLLADKGKKSLQETCTLTLQEKMPKHLYIQEAVWQLI